jgi:glycopeptide antibiotics resistance protein
MFKIDLFDSLEFMMDKQAHLYVSFGLYYFFYTHTVNIFLSISLAFLIGFLYELMQGFTKNHRGFSFMDIIFNVVGIMSAYVLHWIL